MRTKGPSISLEDICNENDFVLLDTCALGDEKKEHIKVDVSARYLERRYRKACRSCRNLSLWNEKIRTHDKIRFTKGVIGELFYYWNVKFLEEIEPFEHIDPSEKVMNCLTTLEDNREFVNKIIDFARKNKRVYDLRNSQEKLYKSFIQENRNLLEKVRGTDFQLLVSGMVLLDLNYHVGIITADSKMIDAFSDLVEEGFSKNLKFYKTSRMFSFKKFESPKKAIILDSSGSYK